MSWQISGQYMETCNCNFLCPCPLTGLAETTHGHCNFAMAFRIERGQFNGTSLNGLSFVVVGHTPGAMADGNWKVGLIADDRASGSQRDGLLAIVGGQAGGPMANLAPLIGSFLGVESKPIRFDGSGKNWSVRVDTVLDQAVEGAGGLGGEQLYLDNAGHPASNRLALARARHSHVHVFGIDWDDVTGRNNGHFAPFDWRG
jgi:hypothetical protein